MHRWMLLFVSVLLLFCWLPASGQTMGEIVGEVVDSSGAVVQGATVTVTNVSTNATRTVQTNDAGLYSFPSLVPGSYKVRVEMKGFKAVTRTDIELQVQQSARINFAMEVGQVTEAVEVSGSAAMLATEDATVGTVIDNRRIVELPLNGRNFLQLVSLSPNVTFGFATPGQASGRQGGDRTSQNISLMGMRGTWNRYTLDGVGKHRRELQPLRRAAFHRCPAGVQGAERHLPGRIRPRRQPDQRLHQVGRQCLPRLAVRVPAQRQAGRQAVRLHRHQAGQEPVQVQPVRFHARRPGLDSEALQRQGQAVLHVQLRGLPPAHPRLRPLYDADHGHAQRRFLLRPAGQSALRFGIAQDGQRRADRRPVCRQPDSQEPLRSRLD